MGTFKFATPAEVDKAMELAKSNYRPKEIRELKERIEGEIRAAEVRASVIGTIDEDIVHKIVAMKFELDSLYSKWVSGEIS